MEERKGCGAGGGADSAPDSALKRSEELLARASQALWDAVSKEAANVEEARFLEDVQAACHELRMEVRRRREFLEERALR